jgi:hypothetical protein
MAHNNSLQLSLVSLHLVNESTATILITNAEMKQLSLTRDGLEKETQKQSMRDKTEARVTEEEKKDSNKEENKQKRSNEEEKKKKKQERNK